MNEDNARELKETIVRYSEASSKSINQEKSSLQFSATTKEEAKRMVVDTLGITTVKNAGKYLSPPTNWGRSKREALG